jgi:hypothetical protein
VTERLRCPLCRDDKTRRERCKHAEDLSPVNASGAHLFTPRRARRVSGAACCLTREAVVAVRNARGEDASGAGARGGSRSPSRSPPPAASTSVRVRSKAEEACVVGGLHETGVNGGTDKLIAALIGLTSMCLGANGSGSPHRFLAMGSLKMSERGQGETRLGEAYGC